MLDRDPTANLILAKLPTLLPRGARKTPLEINEHGYWVDRRGQPNPPDSLDLWREVIARQWQYTGSHYDMRYFVSRIADDYATLITYPDHILVTAFANVEFHMRHYLMFWRFTPALDDDALDLYPVATNDGLPLTC